MRDYHSSEKKSKSVKPKGGQNYEINRYCKKGRRTGKNCASGGIEKNYGHSNQRFPGNYDRGRQNCSEKIRTALRILRLEGKYLRI